MRHPAGFGRWRRFKTMPWASARLRLERLEDRTLLDGGLRAALPDGVVQMQWAGAETNVWESQWKVQLAGVTGSGEQQLEAVNAGLAAVSPDYRALRWLGADGQFLIQGPAELPVDQVQQALAARFSVSVLEPNFVVQSLAIPNDPLFGQLWGLNNTGQLVTGNWDPPGLGTPDADVDAPEAWNLLTGSSGASPVVVGVVDSGVQWDHPDLAANIFNNTLDPLDGIDNDNNGMADDFRGWDFYSNDNTPQDGYGHGTHVAGTIAAVGNNGQGVTGVNWSVKVLPLKIFSDSGAYAGDANVVAALNYMVTLKNEGFNVRLANNSWAGGTYSTLLYNAISNLNSNGMLFVAAAGNDFGKNNDATPVYPASYDLPNVISVASSDKNDQRSNFSNYGPTTVDLYAPGTDVLSTIPTNGYGYQSGTSMATPFVTGAAALGWAFSPGSTYLEIKAAILGGVDVKPQFSSGLGEVLSHGRLNVFKMLQNLGANFLVTSTAPASSAMVFGPAPASFVVHFSTPYDPATVSAGDFTVNGDDADLVTLTDASTLTFSYTTSNPVVAGLNTMSIAADAITGTNTVPLAAFSRQFRYGAVQLAVVSTSGNFTLPGPFTYDVQLNAAVDPDSVGVDDLVLSRGTVTAAAVAGNTARYTIAGITSEGPLDVSIPAGKLTDAFGDPGAAFTASYQVDVGTLPLPAPFEARNPPGSLICDRSVTGLIGQAGDTDTFTLAALAGQTITLLASPTSGGLQPVVELLDPAGAEATAGQNALLQAVTAAAGGTYRIVVRGAHSTVGGYALRVVLNAALEDEGNLAGGNDTLATAQDLGASFLTLSTPQASAWRGAVLGQTDASTPDYYRLTLHAGEAAAVAVTGLSAGNLNVELRDGSNAVLASGAAGASNLTALIGHFVPETTGTYYVRVSGDGDVPYSVVVSRNAIFGSEPNDSFATASSLDGVQGVLGAFRGTTTTLTAIDSGTWDSFGSHDSGNKTYVTGQINAAARRSYFVFDLTAVTQTITAAQLQLSNPSLGYSSPDATETLALFDVSTPLSRLQGSGSGQTSIFKDLGGGVNYGTQAVSGANNGQLIPIPLNDGGLSALNAALGGQIAVGAALTTISGPANQHVFGGTGFAGDTKQLVLTGGADFYSFTVTSTAGPVRLETCTPGGAGPSGNTFDPHIDLFDASGNLVASGAALADGRNEFIEYQPGVTGTYFVRLTAEAGTSGEYFLTRKSACMTPGAGGPYTATYGSSLTLDASASSDPDGDPLTYSWTINGHANAATGVNPTLSWAQLAGLGVRPGQVDFVSVRVDDGHGDSATAETTLTVGAKHVTVGGITARDKTYDGTTAAAIAAAALAGVLPGDDVGLSGTARFDTRGAGAGKAVSVTGLALTGAGAGNYVLDTASAATTASINPLGLTGSITAADKVYDGTAAAAITGRVLAGVLGGDDVSYAGGTASFTDKNAGTGKVVTAAGLGLSGADAGNYTVNGTAATTAGIARADAVITLTPYAAGYDGGAHTAGGSVRGVEPTPADLGGLLRLAGTTHTAAGDYPSDAWSFDGDGNYNPASGTLHDAIAKAALTITAADASRVYGVANPAFTGTIVGVQNNEVISATYSTTATSSSPVGSYAIVPIAVPTASASLSNYSITLVNGTLTVTAFTVVAPLTFDGLIDRNGTVTVKGSFTDPRPPVSHTVVVAWGAGQGSSTINLGAGVTSFATSHAYVPGNASSATLFTLTATVSGVGSASANVAVAAGNGAYNLQRSGDGLNLQLLRGSTLLVNQPLSAIDLVVVVGANNKSDSLTVNYQYGNPIPAGGVGFAGRDSSGEDTLTVSGAAFDLTTYSYTDVNAGLVALTQGAVTRTVFYDDLESITNAGTTRGAVFNLPGDDNDAVLQRSGTSLTLNPADPPWARVYTFTPTKFVNPTESMTVNGGAGDDEVAILGTSGTTLPPSAVMNVELTEVSMISSATLTVGTMVARGDFDIESVGRINGAAIQVYGDVQSENPTLPGSATISLVGSGNQKLSGPGQLPNLDVSKSGGTVKVASDISVAGHLTGTAGTFAPSSAYLVLQGWDSAINVGSAVHLYNVEIDKVYTARVTLLSDLDVLGDLRVGTVGVFDLGSHRLSVGGDMTVDRDATLSFAVDVARPPAQPLLDVAGKLHFKSGSTLEIDTSGSTGRPVRGSYELVQADHLVGFKGVNIDREAVIDSVFQGADSVFFRLV